MIIILFEYFFTLCGMIFLIIDHTSYNVRQFDNYGYVISFAQQGTDLSFHPAAQTHTVCFCAVVSRAFSI